MLRLNLRLYVGTSELLSDRTFEQEEVMVGSDPDSDLVIERPETEQPCLSITYRQGSYRIRAKSGQSNVSLNGAPLEDSPDGTILSHEDLIRFNRYSIVVGIHQAGDSQLVSHLWLLGIAGPMFGYSAQLRASTVIGRQAKGPSEADVLIPPTAPDDAVLSRQHARLTWMPGDVVEFRDISRHAEEAGSWVNRRRAARGAIIPVRLGDEIMIGPSGRHIFRLVRHGDWDFRPPHRVPAGSAVFTGWVARFLLPIGGLVLIAAAVAMFLRHYPLAAVAGAAAAGAGLIAGWRVRLVQRHLAVSSQGRRLEGRVRV